MLRQGAGSAHDWLPPACGLGTVSHGCSVPAVATVLRSPPHPSSRPRRKKQGGIASGAILRTTGFTSVLTLGVAASTETRKGLSFLDLLRKTALLTLGSLRDSGVQSSSAQITKRQDDLAKSLRSEWVDM